MPYFERKPFAELHDTLRMLRDGAGSVSGLDRPRDGALGDKPTLAQQAAAILREQSKSSPAWSLPMTTSGLLWPVTGLSPTAGIMPVVLQAVVRASERARISISIINDSSDDVAYSFAFTDLISPGGERIPRSCIRATPESSVVPAGGTADAGLEIQAPNVSPGPYFGIAACREAPPALLALIVSI